MSCPSSPDAPDTLRRQRFVAESEYLLAEQERIQNRQDLAAESEVREHINAHVTGASGALLAEIADLRQRRLQHASDHGEKHHSRKGQGG